MSADKGKPTKSAKAKAAEAALSVERTAAKARRQDASIEYEDATKDRYFSKDFNTALEAVMRDPLAIVAQRVLAWIKRYSWGEYSLFCIGVDGWPRFQVDCVRELGLKPRHVSKTVAYLRQRGYIEDRPKLLIPVIAPSLVLSTEKYQKSPAYATFLQNWKVANASDFTTWEDARAIDEHFRKVVHAEYRKSQKQATKADPSLLENSQKQFETNKRAAVSPLKESNRRHKTTPANPPVEEGMLTKAQATEYLFTRIRHMQESYPKTPFAKPLIDPEDQGDCGLINRILNELGQAWNGMYDEQHITNFLVYVVAQFKGWGLGGTHKPPRDPGSPTGPKSIGLLVNWAKDFVRIAGRGGAQ